MKAKPQGKEVNRPLRSTSKTSDKCVPSVYEKKTVKSSNSLDLSLVKHSLETSILSPKDVVKAFQSGSAEVQDLLSMECFIIFECKVCCNLFRSISNFVTHKRLYCAKQYTHARNTYLQQLTKHTEAADGMKGSVSAVRKTIKKDILSLLESYHKRQGETENGGLEPTAAFPYTELLGNGLGKPDNNSIEEAESGAEVSVVGVDGRVAGTSRGEASFACSTCRETFPTLEGVTKHAERCSVTLKRCYVCPSCSKYFTTSWAVNRHLKTVHSASVEEIRKLRTMIQKKDMPIIEINKLKKASATPDFSGRTGADDMELAFELNKCCHCGRKFERKAALVSHTHACQRKRNARINFNHDLGKNEDAISSSKRRPNSPVNMAKEKRSRVDQELDIMTVIHSDVRVMAPRLNGLLSSPKHENEHHVNGLRTIGDRDTSPEGTDSVYSVHSDSETKTPDQENITSTNADGQDSDLDASYSRVEIESVQEYDSEEDTLSEYNDTQEPATLLQGCEIIGAFNESDLIHLVHPDLSNKTDQNDNMTSDMVQSKGFSQEDTVSDTELSDINIQPVDDVECNPDLRDSPYVDEKSSNIQDEAYVEDDHISFSGSPIVNLKREGSCSPIHLIRDDSCSPAHLKRDGSSSPVHLKREGRCSPVCLKIDGSSPPTNSPLKDEEICSISEKPVNSPPSEAGSRKSPTKITQNGVTPKSFQNEEQSSDDEQSYKESSDEVESSDEEVRKEDEETENHPLSCEKPNENVNSGIEEIPDSCLTISSESSSDSEPLNEEFFSRKIRRTSSESSISGIIRLEEVDKPFLDADLRNNQSDEEEVVIEGTVSYEDYFNDVDCKDDSSVSEDLSESKCDLELSETMDSTDVPQPDHLTDLHAAMSMYIDKAHFACLLCGKTFPNIDHGANHVAADHFFITRYRCSIDSCNFKSYTKFEAKRHVLLVHKIKKSNIYIKPVGKEEMFEMADDYPQDFLGFEEYKDNFNPLSVYKSYFELLKQVSDSECANSKED